MSKKYVVEGASIHCRYGYCKADRKLYAGIDTCVRAGQKLLITETDNLPACIGGGFGVCTSPYVDQTLSYRMHDNLKNLQQMTKVGGFAGEVGEDGVQGESVQAACNFEPAFLWQGVNMPVEVYGGKTLLEDSWIFCTFGMGLITIDNHGQDGQDPVKLLEENVMQLEWAVSQYMEENGIDESYREALIASVLLWNGYYMLPWKYEGTTMTRGFCAYLEDSEPALFNYFERGIYLPDGNDSIDITYMLGIYKAKEQSGWGHNRSVLSMINWENAEDTGMLNGYLEAYRCESGKSTLEIFKDFLRYYQSPDYDSSSRYTDFLSSPEESMRDFFCEQPIDVLGGSEIYSFNKDPEGELGWTVGDQYIEYNGASLSEEKLAQLNSDTLAYYISREGNAADEDIALFFENIHKMLAGGGE